MDDADHGESASPSERSSNGRLMRLFGRTLAVALASACAVLSTNNWCVILIPAGFAALLLDSVVYRMRRGLIVRLGVAAVVGVSVGAAMRVGPDWAFREAFGIEPPAGIRDVRIQRHYLGGPGEHALMIEFIGDADAVGALTARWPERLGSDRTRQWRSAGGGWAEALEAFGGWGITNLARSSWMRIEPLDDPEVFDFGGVMELGGLLVLFHEVETGRCVALHVRF